MPHCFSDEREIGEEEGKKKKGGSRKSRVCSILSRGERGEKERKRGTERRLTAGAAEGRGRETPWKEKEKKKGKKKKKKRRKKRKGKKEKRKKTKNLKDGMRHTGPWKKRKRKGRKQGPPKHVFFLVSRCELERGEKRTERGGGLAGEGEKVEKRKGTEEKKKEISLAGRENPWRGRGILHSEVLEGGERRAKGKERKKKRGRALNLS